MKTKTYLTASLLAIALASPTAFAKDNKPTNATHQNEHAQTQNNDAKILDILIVINKNEINAANLAAKKATNDQVKNYANLILEHHTKNLQDIESLSHSIGVKPISSAKATSLEQKGKKELKKLQSLNGEAFDKAYIKAMVNDHQNALKLIGNDLQPKANNNELKGHIKATHNTVSQHLQKAKQIQSVMMK